MINVTHRSSSEELADPGSVTREQVRARLADWRNRVHALYDRIADALRGSTYQIDREGKHTPEEELPHRVGLPASEQPAIDILRIARPDRTNAALLIPKGLWIIGANGRVDLRIISQVGRSDNYMLVDQSNPFAEISDWVRIPIGSPFDREPFDPRWLLMKLH